MSLTAKELIKILGEFPEDTMILVDGYEDGLSEISKIKLVNVELNKYTEDYYGPHSISEFGKVSAVYIPRDPNEKLSR